jgi:nucleoside-diphosphate-sugar epimerase
MKALITGSGGLIGSECVRVLCGEGWDVVGIDNDMRAQFFGPEGTTRPVVDDLITTLPTYRHFPLDIRDRQEVRALFQRERPDFVIHTAAQPSHDKAAAIPYDDFDVNAGGTMNMLVDQIQHFALYSGWSYNVGGGLGNSLSLQETTRLCAEIIGNTIPLSSSVATRPADVRLYISDHRLISSIHSWQPRQDAYRTLTDIFNWLRAEETQLRPLFVSP